ncbi:MAG: flagellar hook assembly protein FlgD [Desulfobacterales bacterium]|jgi:flagellar basal-body rod modification protein FlgD|nr:flagellar hook assembly protein FlgD [Desulfobacterales bacterium]
MAIDPVSNASSGLAAIRGSYVDSTQKEDDDRLGQSDFLTMMVAQLQHQDPLNPAQGTEFTSQLAQFSGLEQQINTNTNLAEILKAIEDQGGDQNLLDYIGKEISCQDSLVTLANGVAGGATFSLAEPGQVIVTIFDGAGNQVYSYAQADLAAGTHAVAWNGQSLNGQSVPDGTYRYEIQAISASGVLQEVQATYTGTVTGLTYANGSPQLLMDGRSVDPKSVLSVRMPAEG